MTFANNNILLNSNDATLMFLININSSVESSSPFTNLTTLLFSSLGVSLISSFGGSIVLCFVLIVVFFWVVFV